MLSPEEVYKKLTTADSWYGPFGFMKCKCNNQDLLLEANKIIDEGKVLSEKIILFPSPWHAVIFLILLQKEKTIATKKNIDTFQQISPLIFRGQSNSKWDLVSSLFRLNNKDKIVALEEKKVLSSILEKLFENVLKINSYEIDEIIDCVAQHYGIQTELLDFTPDPSIAVNFANLSKDENRKHTASVFITTHLSALQSNLKVLLPPPLFKRIYKRCFYKS